MSEMTLRERPRPRRLDARAPYGVVLTAAGRAMFEAKAQELREGILPGLLRAVAGEPAEETTRSAYAEALIELRRVESVLAQAQPVAAYRGVPDQVGLGDRVAVEFLGSDGPGPVEEVLLVHPFEAALDLQRISVASPLGAAVLGRRPGEVVQFDAPTGRRAVRILTRTVCT